MTLFALAKLIHVGTVLWTVSGLLGRAYALDASGRATDVRVTKILLDLAGRFERTMVIPGFIAMLITGVVTALLGQYAILGPFQDGPFWIFGSLIIYIAINLLVPTIFLPRGRLFGHALDESIAQGQVTARLRAAFADSTVRWAHRAELAGIAVIIALMVLKPF